MNVICLALFLFFPLCVNAADAEKENLPPNLQRSFKKAVKENIANPSLPLMTSMTDKNGLSPVPSTSKMEEIKFRGKLTEKELETLKQPWEKIDLAAVFGKVEGSFDQHRSLLVSGDTIFKGVKSLTMRSCGLKDETVARIGELFHLQELNLAGNLITDKRIPTFSQLPYLEKLTLSFNKLTDEGMALIASSMPNLTYLNVSSNEEISDVGIEHFLNSTKLTTLIIECNNITNEKAQELRAHINDVAYFPGPKITLPEIIMEW